MTAFPRSRYDSREAIMLRLSEAIYASSKTYKEIAAATGLSPSTVQAVACGKTSWPRPRTFFALLGFFNLTMELRPAARAP